MMSTSYLHTKVRVMAANDTTAGSGRAIRVLGGRNARWHEPVTPDDPFCRLTLCRRYLTGKTAYSSEQHADCRECLDEWQRRARR